MADDSSDEDDGRRPDQLWRIGQRQLEIISRLERLQQKLDEIAQRRDAHDWRVEQFMAAMGRQLEDLLGQIALYGPNPSPPALTKGEHHLTMVIPLEAEIYPDGWTATSSARCIGEWPETVVSPIAVVLVLQRGLEPH